MIDATTDPDAPFLPINDRDFSLRDPRVARARVQSWYARTPYGIAVLRHRQMGELLIHRSLRQGSYAWPALNDVSGVFADWWRRSLLVREGRDHTRLRRIVNPAFAPRVLDAMTPHFHAFANELVDAFIDRGACDYMPAFADPYASKVLCLVLGLPQEVARHVLSLSTDMGLALGVDFKHHEARIEKATLGLFDYADQLIAERRAAPGDDFMSVLVGASDGERLSAEELRDMVLMLVFAGIDTTRNQLGLGMSLFMDHVDQWELLADRPEHAAQAVEEIMRMRPTITWITREATEDLTYNGVWIPKGATIHLLSGAAGGDEAVYEPGFDITATRTRHFGFGGGIHHCLGHTIARSDMQVALAVLPKRMARPAPDGSGVWLPDSGNTGPVSLPITFGKRA